MQQNSCLLWAGMSTVVLVADLHLCKHCPKHSKVKDEGTAVRVGLHFGVALPEHILEALLQQQAVKGLPLFRGESSRGQVPAGQY